ncbi:MAG: hypothetical protein ACFFCF_05870 [Promethearchaeota archaeon]
MFVSQFFVARLFFVGLALLPLLPPDLAQILINLLNGMIVTMAVALTCGSLVIIAIAVQIKRKSRIGSVKIIIFSIPAVLVFFVCVGCVILFLGAILAILGGFFGLTKIHTKEESS